MLAAGIDVFSTVNVQHLESLNDQVAELTGVRVRETFPDAVLADADEVVLVDVTPPALIERLRHGKVYKPERVPAALNGFFRVEHLEALREVALRQVAEGVEAKRLVREPRPCATTTSRCAPQAVGERLLAIVTPQPASQRIVRRAWRSAQRLGAELDVLTVLPPGGAARGGRAGRRAAAARLAAGRHRARRGGRRRRRGRRPRRARARDDVRAHGRAGARRGLGRLRAPLAERLLRALPGVDIRLVADRSRRDRRPR